MYGGIVDKHKYPIGSMVAILGISWHHHSKTDELLVFVGW